MTIWRTTRSGKGPNWYTKYTPAKAHFSVLFELWLYGQVCIFLFSDNMFRDLKQNIFIMFIHGGKYHWQVSDIILSQLNYIWCKICKILKMHFQKTAELIKNSYHNDQSCRSYKTPNEIGIKSKPTSVMIMEEKWHSGIAHEINIGSKWIKRKRVVLYSIQRHEMLHCFFSEIGSYVLSLVVLLRKSGINFWMK